MAAHTVTGRLPAAKNAEKTTVSACERSRRVRLRNYVACGHVQIRYLMTEQ